MWLAINLFIVLSAYLLPWLQVGNGRYVLFMSSVLSIEFLFFKHFCHSLRIAFPENVSLVIEYSHIVI